MFPNKPWLKTPLHKRLLPKLQERWINILFHFSIWSSYRFHVFIGFWLSTFYLSLYENLFLMSLNSKILENAQLEREELDMYGERYKYKKIMEQWRRHNIRHFTSVKYQDYINTYTVHVPITPWWVKFLWIRRSRELIIWFARLNDVHRRSTNVTQTYTRPGQRRGVRLLTEYWNFKSLSFLSFFMTDHFFALFLPM